MHILVEHQIKYLNRRLHEIEELKLFLLNNQFDEIYIIGHKLKGNGETFGYAEIGEFGKTLECASSEKNKEKISETIELLARFVEKKLNK